MEWWRWGWIKCRDNSISWFEKPQSMQQVAIFWGRSQPQSQLRFGTFSGQPLLRLYLLRFRLQLSIFWGLLPRPIDRPISKQPLVSVSELPQLRPQPRFSISSARFLLQFQLRFSICEARLQWLLSKQRYQRPISIGGGLLRLRRRLRNCVTEGVPVVGVVGVVVWHAYCSIKIIKSSIYTIILYWENIR